MKRLMLTALAATMLAAPVAAPAFAQAQPHQYSDYRDNNRDDNRNNDRDWNRDRDNNRDWNRDNDRDRDWNRNDNRYNSRFDERRHNGYYIGRAWHYGPPPASAYRARDFHPGYKAWKRGDRLGYYGNRYVEVDYRARHLKAPPRGYRYVKDDRGDILLAAVATGIIAAIIASSN
jgi:Ni/Co efflux regulator RcnB